MLKKIKFARLFCCTVFICASFNSRAQIWETQNKQAIAHYNDGKIDSAIFYGGKALAHAEEKFGKLDSNYATILNNQASYYDSKGNYAGAEPFYTEVMAIRKQVLGTEHPDYVSSLNALATLYINMGHYTKAEPLHIEVLVIYKKLFGTEHPNYASSLNGLARLYQAMGNYSKAEPIYVEALAVYKKALGTEHSYYTTVLNNLADLYQSMGNYVGAEALLTEVLAIRNKALGTDHPDYAMSLNTLASLYYSTDKYTKAEPLYIELLAISKKNHGTEHEDYANSLRNLAVLYDSMESYSRAEPLYVEALTVLKKVLGTEHADYILCLSNLAALYRSMENYIKAELLYVEVLAIQKKVLGKEHADYASSLNYLGIVYRSMDNYAQAESVYIEALAIREKVLGTGHPDYAASLSNLAVVYKAMGNYERAESLYNLSLAIRKKAPAGEDAGYASSLDSFAGLNEAIGNYAKAESLYTEALAIRKRVVGTGHQDYAASLNNLGLLYREMGIYDKAESFLEEALAIDKSKAENGFSRDATLLNNLGVLYESMGNKVKAEPLFTEALGISKKVFGAESLDYATPLNNLAHFYFSTRDYARAEPLYTEAMAIFKKGLGIEHPYYALSLNNLATLYSYMRKYSQAETLYVEALAIRKRKLGAEHPDYGRSLNNLGNLHRIKGDYVKADPIYHEASNIQLANISRNFGFLSEQEKEKNLESIRFNFDGYHSFFKEYQAQKPSVSAEAFNLELATKGMILSSGLQLKRAIHASGSDKAIELYENWNKLMSILSRQSSLPIADRRSDTDSLEYQATIYEKELAKLSTSFRQGQILTKATWESIRNTLGPGEVAIEFTNFRYHTGNRWTDTSYYSALILRKGDAYPAMVNLCRQDQLDSLLNKKGSHDDSFIADLYRGGSVANTDTSIISRRKLYRLLWKPLESVLRLGDHVYFAPSGLLHQVSFAAIPAEDGSLISDRYRLTQLSSTAMLLHPPPVLDKKNLLVAAFGGIRYDAEAPELLAALPAAKSKETVSRAPDRGGSDRGTAWNYLPGTLTETTAIAALGKKYDVPVTSYSGAAALEETYKGFSTGKSPAIIHIATHGFFFPDPKKEERAGRLTGEKQEFRVSGNPLNRSGLLFAGANRVWKGDAADPALEDGILTAFEASHVSLSNTALVALSACETGLGEIKGSEGVFGLQRAFKAAGAGYLLMSFWKVPDAETAEFMTEFYGALFSGKTIEESFAGTQTVMKTKYKNDPYKWAAFVLVR